MGDSLAVIERAGEVARRARASGALRPLASEAHVVEDAGVAFRVHVLTGADPKSRAAGPAATRTNPFLPPAPELLVGDLSPTHVCLLNKFPVLDGHLLAVTRRFEPQDRAPGAADLDALWRLLAGVDGLGFYNSGPEAGASQPHKHLQLVPPFGGALRTPIEPLLGPAGAEPGSVPGLPFVHRAVRLPGGLGGAAGAALEEAVRGLRAALSTAERARPWNLLLTRDWMLLVPRSRGRWEGASVNALGFAGSLAVRGAAALARVRERGPMRILREVALTRGGNPPPPRD